MLVFVTGGHYIAVLVSFVVVLESPITSMYSCWNSCSISGVLYNDIGVLYNGIGVFYVNVEVFLGCP